MGEISEEFGGLEWTEKERDPAESSRVSWFMRAFPEVWARAAWDGTPTLRRLALDAAVAACLDSRMARWWITI
jgi:hypothetical protein